MEARALAEAAPRERCESPYSRRLLVHVRAFRADGEDKLTRLFTDRMTFLGGGRACMYVILVFFSRFDHLKLTSA